MFINTESASTESKKELRESTKYKIMVIDDNEELLEVIKEVLSFHGYQVLISSEVNQAIEIFNHTVPDLIICDILLPDKDGFEFFEFVRHEQMLVDIPFIFLSALNSPDHIKSGKEIGCDDYLTKPFDLEELLSVIKGKLRTASLRKQNSEMNASDYKRKIIQTLSHEFRTPLVSLTSGTQILKGMHKDLSTEELVRLLTTIQSDGRRLERLVNDFMLMQQIESGQADKTYQNFCRKQNAIEVLEQAIESFHEDLTSPGDLEHLQLNISGQEVLSAEINIYDVHFIKVIQHLLSNALRFTDRTLGIRISAFLKENNIFIQIRDFGPGISNSLKEKVCEPFTQVNREYFEQQGAGLGLAIVRKLTEVNKGQFSFEDTENNVGLIVQLKFPVA